MQDCEEKNSGTVSTKNCPACGGVFRLKHGNVSDSFTGETFSIGNCSECGLGVTDPEPVDLSGYYPPVYYGNRHGLTARFCINRRLGILKKFLPDSTGKKLLDIGCGDGSFLAAAKKNGFHVTGLERDGEAAAKAGIEVFGDIDRCDPDCFFDVVTAWHSLEHIAAPVEFLNKISARLVPEGFFIAAVPNNDGWQARATGSHWLHLDVPRHLFHYTPESLRVVLNQAGFELIWSGHQEFEYDLLGWSQSVLNWLFPCFPQNCFFLMLTGKMKIKEAPIAFGFGLLMTALCLPLVPLATLFRKGGTLIVVARKKRNS